MTVSWLQGSEDAARRRACLGKEGLTLYRIRRRGSRASGFTLIEVLLAITLTTVGVLGAASLITSTSITNRRIREETAAARACRHALENVRSLPWNAIADRNNAPLLGDVPELSEMANGAGSLTIAPYQGQSDIKQVTIRVTWTEPGMGQQEWQLITLVGPAGLVRR